MTKPYALVHGQRYRSHRFPTNSGVPRFATTKCGRGCWRRHRNRSAGLLSDARGLRLLCVAESVYPLPPMTPSERPMLPIGRWRRYQ